ATTAAATTTPAATATGGGAAAAPASASNAAASSNGSSQTLLQQQLVQLDQVLQQLGIDPQAISMFDQLALLVDVNDPAAIEQFIAGLSPAAAASANQTSSSATSGATAAAAAATPAASTTATSSGSAPATTAAAPAASANASGTASQPTAANGSTGQRGEFWAQFEQLRRSIEENNASANGNGQPLTNAAAGGGHRTHNHGNSGAQTNGVDLQA
ncbi:MAG: hypothetical protein WB813_13860, partial [Candidatus Acidiferrales bacterium]